MKEKILLSADSPRDIEILYRANPKDFARCFPDAYNEKPDSLILKAWHERLFYDEETKRQSSTPHCRSFDVWLTILLVLVAGTLTKLPQFFSGLNEEFFYTRNLGAIVAGSLLIYFCIQKSRTKHATITLLASMTATILYLNLLPDKPRSQTIVLSCIHMPFFFWSLVGISFLGNVWRKLSDRMDYIRYNGELLIYTTMVLIGGMVLTGLTFALFSLIKLQIENWYMNYVVVYGAIASPIVATLLVHRVVGDRFRLAPLLAKVFTPLFLVTVIVYLVAMAIQQRSPFTDREFLIAFNGLLLVVLGLCVFSISERGTKSSISIFDLMNMSLVSVTLVIDIVALSAILFRLTSYGFTPNRITVLGANILVFCHLAGILYHYLLFARNRITFSQIEKWIAGYLPVYTTWSLFVAVGLPLILWFK